MRAKRIVPSVIFATAIVVGCRGSVDRSYFDDDDDDAGADARSPSPNLDATTDATSDATTESDSATTDASSDASSDAADAMVEAGAPRTVGGKVVGLTGTGLVLRLNGANDNPVNALDGGADVNFTFGSTLVDGNSFAVTVPTQPTGQTCYVTGGSGSIQGSNITNVVVKCVRRYVLQESFDGVTAPNVPATWSTTRLDGGGGNPTLFTSVTTANGQLPAPDTALNSMNVGNFTLVSQIALTSPSFTVDSSNATLTFKHAYALEASKDFATAGYDGAVLEISTDGGTTWNDIGETNFTAGGYNRTLSSSYQNNLGGRKAWSGWTPPSTWVTTTVKLPLTAGQSARIRFQVSTDKQNVDCDFAPNTGCLGFRVDSLTIAN
jgi:hypothetical protein